MPAGAAACVALLALLLAGCSNAPITAGVPRVVERLVIAPYALHEECVHADRGDRLDYRYESSEPLDFNIHYHERETVLAPVVREQSTADSGTYAARLAQEYCLVVASGSAGRDHRLSHAAAAGGAIVFGIARCPNELCAHPTTACQRLESSA